MPELTTDTARFLEAITASDAIRAVVRQAAEIDWPGGRPVVTRFAPSPTGDLHLGHALHALWVWGVARAFDARVLVRMEDHDRRRCRPEFESGILDDLAWLGLGPDGFSLASLAQHPSPFRQSDVPERYETALAHLRRVTEVYACTCTRADLGPADDSGERRYPGTCRGQPFSVPGRHVLRVRLPDDAITAYDLTAGPTVLHPAQDSGDPVIRDALGQWTYQFCVVVDDLAHGVNLVARGEDLRSSTGRQAALANLLGRPEPVVTVHHPLLHASGGKKLSKRDRSETIRSRRQQGQTAIEVMREAWERGRET